MSIQFKSARINFDATSGIVQKQSGTVEFVGHWVNHAEVALMGFDIQYVGEDHHVLREMIAAKVASKPGKTSTVKVQVDFLLRDGDGQIDDAFKGWVDVVVMAELVLPESKSPT